MTSPHPAPPAPAPQRDLATSGLGVKLLWISALYFASGFPYGVLNELLPIYFRRNGGDLDEIGAAIGAAGMAWTLKFLWAPAVDRFGTRKQWIVGCQLALALTIGLLVLGDPRALSTAFIALLFAIAAVSATQDITLDAYAIEILEERELGPANGIRVTAYRAAMLTASGLLIFLADVTGWRSVFIAGAVLMLGIALLTMSAPARHTRQRAREPIWQPIRALFGLPHLWAVILFALTFKLGDSAMLVMARTFLVDAGLTNPQIATLGIFSVGAIVAGSLLGGFLILRWGIFRSLWVLGAIQALSNLGYWVAATWTRDAVVFAAKLVEDFTGGMGTAAFITFLMSICQRRYAATQYALLSALFVVSRQIATFFSGALTQTLGYSGYFLLTFGLALPAFALLYWIRNVRRHEVEPVID